MTIGGIERESFLGGVGKYENLRISKNVIVLGLAFMVHFTAFHGTANLQSSVNSDGSLGTYTLASIYGSLILSNILLPAGVIRWLGCKWTIALSFIAYMPFIAAQFYPKFYTLVPAALAVGFGGGPLWCAKCTYLTVIAEAFSILLNGETKQDVLVVRFFGLFFLFYQMAQIWGNLISSAVLSIDSTALATPIMAGVEGGGDMNSTLMIVNTKEMLFKNVGELCGANFCPGVGAQENPNLQPPEPYKIQLLSGIFLGLMVGACILVALFADSLKRYDMGRKGSGAGLSGLKLLGVTITQMIKFKQIILLPITMFVGAEQAFIAVDFTNSFVACGWGISRIGYAMICFGIANTLAAGAAGALAKIVGRYTIMIIAMLLHGSLIIWMRLWIAVDSDYMTYCIMAAIWGLADGIFLVQVNSFYGIIFSDVKEAAFCNFRLFESIGSVITYLVSPILCTGTKLMMLLGLMGVGMVGYSYSEFIKRKESQQGNNNNQHVELNGNFTGRTQID